MWEESVLERCVARFVTLYQPVHKRHRNASSYHCAFSQPRYTLYSALCFGGNPHVFSQHSQTSSQNTFPSHISGGIETRTVHFTYDTSVRLRNLTHTIKLRNGFVAMFSFTVKLMINMKCNFVPTSNSKNFITTKQVQAFHSRSV